MALVVASLQQLQPWRMMDIFELHPDDIRDHLKRISEEVPSCVLKESRAGRFQDFVKFEISGAIGTATLTIIVNSAVEHFEFSVGEYMYYEGDYPPCPRALDFLVDLVETVLRGKVEEWRYFFISPRISKASKVTVEVQLSRHPPFGFTQCLSIFSFLATRKFCHKYLPYEEPEV